VNWVNSAALFLPRRDSLSKKSHTSKKENSSLDDLVELGPNPSEYFPAGGFVVRAFFQLFALDA
jgi:hypothetical protein